jgi:hypothetical protein
MSMDYHATHGAGDRKALMRCLFITCALLITGCSSALTEARQSFDEARYPDAVAAYRAVDSRKLEGPQLFHYALYRGLSHLALGDAAPAERWLIVAKRLCERSPTLATPDERGRLSSAWRSMGHMPGE